MLIGKDYITLRRPDDFHVHLRSEDLLRKVIGPTAKNFARALVMPNLSPDPILSGQQAADYLQSIRSAIDCCAAKFTPLMTIQIIENTDPQTVVEARNKFGVVAGKIYPRGMTTNSENGVYDYTKIYPALEAMQDCGMVACFHGESPDPKIFCLNREGAFLQIFFEIAEKFPRLKMVLEHVTTMDAADLIDKMPETVAATITVHHLLLTLNDVIGDKLEPHNFCKPVAKLLHDRIALVDVVTSGNPKFFLGTDSAPHLRHNKECAHGCAGIYTASVAMPLLAQIFDEQAQLHCLEYFTSVSGAAFYGLPMNSGTITIERKPQTVPDEIAGIVPFMAGKEIVWTVKE